MYNRLLFFLLYEVWSIIKYFEILPPNIHIQSYLLPPNIHIQSHLLPPNVPNKSRQILSLNPTYTPTKSNILKALKSHYILS